MSSDGDMLSLRPLRCRVGDDQLTMEARNSAVIQACYMFKFSGTTHKKYLVFSITKSL